MWNILYYKLSSLLLSDFSPNIGLQLCCSRYSQLLAFLFFFLRMSYIFGLSLIFIVGIGTYYLPIFQSRSYPMIFTCHAPFYNQPNVSILCKYISTFSIHINFYFSLDIFSNIGTFSYSSNLSRVLFCGITYSHIINSIDQSFTVFLKYVFRRFLFIYKGKYFSGKKRPTVFFYLIQFIYSNNYVSSMLCKNTLTDKRFIFV